MKILLTGAKGQLGFKIAEILSAGHDLILTDRDSLDITDQKKVADLVEKENPDVIIQAAAYTKVDQAEEEVELCQRINVDGTYHLARAAKEIKALMIYFSTDYVFSGKKKTPYEETDKPEALSVYGQTKHAGEKIVRYQGEKYYIIRTSWVFGETPKDYTGANFVQKMLFLANQYPELKVVNDQIGSPTYTKDLVEIVELLIDQYDSEVFLPFGIYHFSGEGECSWFDFAKEIFKQKKLPIAVKPIKTEELPLKAQRPKYSYLSKEKIKQSLGIEVRSWQEMLAEYRS